MSDILLILRARHRRRRLSPFRQSSHLVGKVTSLVIGLLLLVAILTILWIYNSLWANLPSLEQLPVLLSNPHGQLLQPTTLYDRTGQQVIAVLENPAAQGRQYIPLNGDPESSLPQDLVDATLAAVDPGFWQHSGYLLNDWDPNSHPTLAQKLVFELLLSEESASLRRGLRERLLAGQATLRFGREQILEWYLNHARYGALVFGADAAARVYFGKPANQLTLADAAALVAMGQMPEVSPFQAPQLIVENRDSILQAMLENGWISANQESQAARQTLVLQPQQPGEDLAPAFEELVIQQLESIVPRSRLEWGGFRIITTLDIALQYQVNCAGSAFIERYTLDTDLDSESTGRDVTCPAARLLPTLPQQYPTGLPNLQSAIVILDPQTGQILSLSGDVLLASPARSPQRPSGTLTLPFLYLNAFSRGFSPGTLAWDIPPADPTDSIDQDTYHGPVRLRTALVNDYLAPANQLINQLGLDTTLTTASQLGALTIQEQANQNTEQLAQTALGNLLSEPASLLGMAKAYATLDHQGILTGQEIPLPGSSGSLEISPYTVLRLENNQRQVLLDWSRPVERAVLSPQLAYLLNHSLSDEVTRWHSLGHPNPFEIGRPAAAKAGQTIDQQDAWAVGYTPQRLVGVWLGSAVPSTSAPISIHAAAALWHAVIQYALRGLPTEGWNAPLGISEVQVCDPSGQLPTVYCPLTATEVFLTGTEPTQEDHLYQSFQINRETGRLATVFTRPELVEEKVFMIVPPEARSWALQAGLPTPPEDYDILSILPSKDPAVNIRMPDMFSHVRGLVTLTGSAEGAGFQFYRLYFGQGVNPQQWWQIGTDSDKLVKEGKLGTWDTQGLNGLYTLQLQVVRLEQRIQTELIQVTVDNTVPQITLLSPAAGAEIYLDAQPNIVFHAAASDNLELAQVVFLLDGRQIAVLSESPYLISWPGRLGAHTLIATATDMAGNQTSAEITFRIK